MTQRLDARLDTYHSPVLGIFRIVIGFLFTIHGTSKLFAWPVWYAGVIELVVGLLVLVGLFTRIAALIGSGEMAFAYFTQHQPKGLWPLENGGELAVLYCFSLFLIAFAGAGAFAIHGRKRH